MIATPVTVVTDTASGALRLARALVADGVARLTSHVGGSELKARLLRGDTPAVVVLDLFMEMSGPEFLRDLEISGLSMDGAVVVVVTDDARAAEAAGADLWVSTGDVDDITEAVREACMRHKAREINRLRAQVAAPVAA